MEKPPPYWPGYDSPGKFTRQERSGLIAALNWGSDYFDGIALLSQGSRGLSRTLWSNLLTHSNDWQPLFLVLLMCCPNLEMIRIYQVHWSDNRAQFLASQVEPFLEHAIVHQLPLFAGEASCTKSLYGLQRLETLIMDAIEIWKGHVIFEVQKWMCIPTLRKFGSLYLKSFDRGARNRGPFYYSSQMPLWNKNLYQFFNLEAVVMVLASFTPADLAMCVRGMPKLKQLIYSDENKFEMFGWTVNMNGHEITWDTAEGFVDHFRDAYGVAQLKERRLGANGRGNLVMICQVGYGLVDDWFIVIESKHCAPADVEHYLQAKVPCGQQATARMPDHLGRLNCLAYS